MLQDIAVYLIKIAASLFGAALLLRAWALAVRLPPRNPFSQAVFQATSWLVVPLRKIIPGVGGIDWASLLGTYLSALALLVLTLLVQGGSPLSLFPFGLAAALLLVLNWALNLVFWLTLLLGVMSWINPASEGMWLLQILVGPLLNPIRRRLPATGGIDFSPLVLIIVVQVLHMVLDRVQMMLFLF
jgi:YggT family protein